MCLLKVRKAIAKTVSGSALCRLREAGLRFFESSVWAVLVAQFDKFPKLFSNCSILSSTLCFQMEMGSFTFLKSYVKEASDVYACQYTSQVKPSFVERITVFWLEFLTADLCTVRFWRALRHVHQYQTYRRNALYTSWMLATCILEHFKYSVSSFRSTMLIFKCKGQSMFV